MATFDHLATETIQMILEQVVEGETNPEIRYNAIYCLRTVTKMVKNVVDHAPAMWTLVALDVSRISVDISSTSATVQLLQDEILTRVVFRAKKAKALPTTFLIKHTKHVYHTDEALCAWCSVMASDDAFTMPFDQIAHLYAIDVSLPPSHMQRIFNFSSPPPYFHRLRELSLEKTDPRETFSPNAILFGKFPLLSLRKLSLTYALIAELAWVQDSPPRLPDLRELILKSDREEEVDAIAHVLPQCPRLVRMNWSSWAPRRPLTVYRRPDRPSMEFLKELEIHSNFGQITQVTFASFKFPALEKVLLIVWSEGVHSVEDGLDAFIPHYADLVTQVQSAPKSLNELVSS